jgi:hypothetical protein
MRINLTGPFIACREMLRRLLPKERQTGPHRQYQLGGRLFRLHFGPGRL